MTDQPTTALKVLVTGASEALGREVVRQLVTRGHQVAAVTGTVQGAGELRQDGALPIYSSLFRPGELASNLKMFEADVIVNAAPQVINAFPPYQPDWDGWVNLLHEGTLALVEAAQATGVKYIVHTSFAFLYGDKHGEAVDESAKIATSNPLFKAAADAEKVILNSGIPASVLRAGFLYGPESGTVLGLRDALRGSAALPLGDDHNVVNWVHTLDLAQAIVLAAEQQPANEIFNIVDDQPVSAGTFADHFADQYGVKRPGRQRMPGVLAQFLVNPNQQALLDVSAAATNTKAKNQLGWTLKYPNQHAGVEQTLLAWRAHS